MRWASYVIDEFMMLKRSQALKSLRITSVCSLHRLEEPLLLRAADVPFEKDRELIAAIVRSFSFNMPSISRAAPQLRAGPDNIVPLTASG